MVILPLESSGVNWWLRPWSHQPSQEQGSAGIQVPVQDAHELLLELTAAPREFPAQHSRQRAAAGPTFAAPWLWDLLLTTC